MFHQGTLQEGIAKAVQESKSVLCFVTDGGPESSTWEDEWLQDQSVPNSIERHAIALRLEAGSTEAGFLAAFCPISHIPTIVVIYNGQPQEQLNQGITKNDFTLRLLRSINRSQASPPSTSTDTTPQQNTSSSQASSSQPSSAQPAVSQTPNSPPQPARTPTQSPVQDPASPPATTTRTRPPNEISYAEQQAKRKREAKLERERILRIIENDKVERREREEERRRAAQAQAQEEGQDDDQLQPTNLSISAQSNSVSSSTHTTTRIQVRLTDGSTVRNAFPSTALLSAVRAWVDAERTDGNAPYTLKQILTPHPSRALTDANERETLGELGLAPSASLVMVPAKGAVSAYASRVAPRARAGVGAGGGALESIRLSLVGLWVWLVAMVRTFLGLDMPREQAASSRASRQGGATGTAETRDAKGDARAATGSSSSSSAAPSGIRIRTLRDQHGDGRDRQQEMYNGNQLNFEPNADDENNDGDNA